MSDKTSSCNLIMLKFRPSSHSSDHAIICTYENEKTAHAIELELKALKKSYEKNFASYDLDWDPSEIEIERKDAEVTFVVNTAYEPTIAEKIMKSASPVNTETFENFQEFAVYLTTPPGLTVNGAPLVLSNEEASLMQWLNLVCGLPKTVNQGARQTLKWVYRGETVYEEGDKTFQLEEYTIISIKNKRNWKITVWRD